MGTRLHTEQVRIEHDDERVRCGGALFTPSFNELHVIFDADGRDARRRRYNLGSIPFNRTARIHDDQGRPMPYLVCNQWGTLYVRYGEVPAGSRYPALRVHARPRRVRITSDVMNAGGLSACAFHPNEAIPLYVVLRNHDIKLSLNPSGCATFEMLVPLRKLGTSGWYVPRDPHGQRLPLRLRRPLLGALLGMECVDVEWLD